MITIYNRPCRPLLFKGEMIEAVLDRHKRQTRRLIKPQPPQGTDHIIVNEDPRGLGSLCISEFEGGEFPGLVNSWRKCPYGQVGDFLWCREAWTIIPNPINSGSKKIRTLPDGRGVTWKQAYPDGLKGFKWRPSIHLPFLGTRIILEVTGIRAERLLGISEEDAKAEGISCWTRFDMARWGIGRRRASGEREIVGETWQNLSLTARDAYLKLWDRINPEMPREMNPWVWVVEFSIHDLCNDYGRLVPCRN
jgi:hypothetical protein